MKIVHLHFGKDGGAERFFVNLANALGERSGIEQKFFIRPNRSWRKEIEHLGVITEDPFRYISPKSLWLKLRFPSLMRKEKPDAIMAWMPRAARLIPSLDGVVKLVRLGDYPRHLNHFNTCDVLVCNNPDIGEHCKRIGWSKPLRTISNFPRHVPADPIARSQLDTPEDAFVISGSGRFVHRKGFDTLLTAASKLPKAYVWLVGDGEEKANLQAQARELGISERVRFIGWVKEPAPYIAGSDVFCMPSRHEPLGNVVLEAWQLKVPTVASASEGPTWFMQDGENGLVFPIDDVNALASALLRLQNEQELRQKIVAGATQTAQTMFTKEAVVEQYLKLIEEFKENGHASSGH